MKNSLKILVFSSLLALPLAANAQNPPQPTDSTQQVVPNVTEFDKQLPQMQEALQKMQEQMSKIQQTKDPQERQKLLQDHWATMQSAMQTMRGMWGPSMMGGGHMDMMGWNKLGGAYANLTPKQMRQRQYMMDQYMGMQQQMMNNMMQHQNWMMMQPTQ